MNLVAHSDSLHARVIAFARAQEPGADDFERLALDIALFQVQAVPGFRRMVAARGSELSSVESIPAVPVDAFRVARVAAHAATLDSARFVTSGTTGAAVGIHPFRRTDTYETLALRAGRVALRMDPDRPCTVVALLPPPSRPPTSSLAFMAQCFMESWDGRLPSGAESFGTAESERWLVDASGVDVAGLCRASARAIEREEGLIVVATSFALVQLLERLEGRRIVAPSETVVMPTGGYKGRARSVDPFTLIAAVARTFDIDPAQVVGEYGMTELSSQLYEGTLPGRTGRTPHGIYVPPHWLQVTPVDPTTLAPVDEGEVGLARFVDLANIDSAVAVVTQDRIRRSGAGFTLHGRCPDAPPRGCSLAMEALLDDA